MGGLCLTDSPSGPPKSKFQGSRNHFQAILSGSADDRLLGGLQLGLF